MSMLLRVLAALFVSLAVAASAAASAKDAASGQFEILTLSNRADFISGGDALVEVRVPRTVPLHQVTLWLNGRNVTAAFRTDTAARTMRGVLTGLEGGQNEFLADSNGRGHGRPRASLTITNHPIGGPVLLGSQTTPWICATPTPTPAIGQHAGDERERPVDLRDRRAMQYRDRVQALLPDDDRRLLERAARIRVRRPLPPTNNCFKPYTPGSAPADLAMTTTTAGLTVPYIVRVERGTINRGIYDIAVLFDPSKPWSALSPQAQWNGKVVYTFGASTGQPRLQFRSEQNWADNAALSRGFMVVDNSLTDSLYNSNRVLNAETLMMMKEHIVDTYGEITYTLGNGCSGGSIQQNTAASIYPGLLDGIQPSCDYPDSITTGLEVGDCVLLVNFYAGPEWAALMGGLTQAQINAKKTAINGHLDHLGCQSWNNAFGHNNKPGNYVPVLVVNQTTGAMAPVGAPRNNCLLPAALVYDPVTNPNGTRCGDADLATAVWGTTNGIVPGSLRARQTGDNVGIQYGLNALLAGAITPEEFVTLNEKIGGFDADANRTAARTTADSAALRICLPRRHRRQRREPRQAADHRLARLRRAGHPLHLAQLLGARPHRRGQRWQSRQSGDVALRDGSVARDGSAGRGGDAELAAGHGHLAVEPDGQRAEGDDQLRAHPGGGHPGETGDGVRSVLPDRRRDLLHAGHRHGAVRCRPQARATLLASPSRRRAARGEHPEVPAEAAQPGGLRAGRFSSTQLARLQATFPDGVCDWSLPGVGQQAAVSPLTFVDGPGGAPLPPAPVSQASPEH